MGELLLLNPRKRGVKRRTKGALKRRTKGALKRRSNPIAVNTYRPIRKRRRMPAFFKSRRRYRRNPVNVGGIQKDVMRGVTGAGGAIASEMVLSRLTFLPPQMTTGPMRQLAKGLIGVGLGMLANKAKMRQMGKDVALGTLTVAAHDLIKGYLPAGTMGEYDDMEYLDNQVGEYNYVGEYSFE